VVVALVREIARAVQAQHVIIEDKASGTELIQDLRAEGLFQVKAYVAPSQADKIMRLHAQTTKFESGRVLLPKKAPWLTEYVRELASFPGSKVDDQVDSATQALDYLGTTYRTAEIWARLAE
jgi:predicted phage terminase large subunit-like protein